MAKTFDRVKFSVPGAPGTGTITVGTRSDNSFFLPEEQGAVDGDQVYYVIQKSNKDTEVGIGTIASGQTQVTRDTVLSSIVGGVAGTSKLNIDGTAFMALVTPAELLQSLRSVRTVTGATDTLLNGDGFGQVTYNRSTAIAVSIAQAGTSLKFLQGWCCFLRNIGAGAATITPATSTINGASTLVLNQGDSALLVSDGSNYTAIVWTAASIRYDVAQNLTTAQQAQARANSGAADAIGVALDRIYQSKNLAAVRRVPNAAADGYKASDGIDSGSSSSYTLDTSAGKVGATVTGGALFSNSAASYSASSTFAGSASQAFSGTGSWQANSGAPAWISFDMGAGNAKALSKVTLQWHYAGNKTGTIDYSDDGSSWTTAINFNYSAAVDVDQDFTQTVPTAHRYWRVNVTAYTGSVNIVINKATFYDAGSVGNMTLVTASQTADASASKATVTLEVDNSASLNFSTPDLTIEVTCNGGANWTTATILGNTFAGTGQSGRKVIRTDEMTCTAGTSIQARIKTFGKNIPNYGREISWR